MTKKQVLSFAVACLTFFAVIMMFAYENDDFLRRGEPFGVTTVALGFVIMMIVAPVLWFYLKRNSRGRK